MSKEHRFPILHIVSAIFKILAWIVAVADIILIVVLLTKKTNLSFPSTTSNLNFGGSPYLLAGIVFLAGVFYFLLLYALAEGIMVAVAIEENTRKALKQSPEKAPEAK
jgi:lysylphosphatidylglycerol synthetase-like protein (DUF2156 family)